MKRRDFIQLATVTSVAAVTTNVSAQNRSFELNEATIVDLQNRMRSGDMSAE